MMLEETEISTTVRTSEHQNSSAESQNHPNLQVAEPDIFPALPRSAWSSQLAQLRILLKAKQALDRQEKECLNNCINPALSPQFPVKGGL